MKKEPLIAVIGSLREELVESPEQAGAGHAFCQALGKTLAKHHIRLAVYGDQPDYIEPYVVTGFAAVAKDRQGAIRCFQGINTPAFPERKRHPALFDIVPDQDPNFWEVGFYRSFFREVDGFILIGGKKKCQNCTYLRHGNGKTPARDPQLWRRNPGDLATPGRKGTVNPRRYQDHGGL